jgi:glycosyltransferase involved in cell wall biosynthesis
LSVLHQPVPGKNYAYKLGVEHAKYEYLLTCDDDNLLHPNYVADVFRIMQSDTMIGVLGGCGIFYPEQPAWNEIDLHKQSYINGSQHWAATANWVYGAGSTCRRSNIMEFYAKGWHQITSGRTGSKLICGEDIEICFMFFLNGYKIIADNSLTFDHFVPLKRQNSGYILDLKYWISYSYVLLNNYLMLMDADQRTVQKKLNDWFIASLKGMTRLSMQIARQKLFTFKSPSVDQRLNMKGYLGIMRSIYDNRQRLIEQYKELGSLLKLQACLSNE